MVLYNASAHTAKAFKGRRKQLTKIGVEPFHLPPRSPELNDIELVWRQAKHQDHPQRDRIRQSATNRFQAAQPRLGQIGPWSVQMTPLLRHRQKGWPIGSV